MLHLHVQPPPVRFRWFAFRETRTGPRYRLLLGGHDSRRSRQRPIDCFELGKDNVQLYGKSFGKGLPLSVDTAENVEWKTHTDTLVSRGFGSETAGCVREDSLIRKAKGESWFRIFGLQISGHKLCLFIHIPDAELPDGYFREQNCSRSVPPFAGEFA